MTESPYNSQPGNQAPADSWQYTRCPECEAVFRVDQTKLEVRQGEVRCGACRFVFHAPSHKVFRNHGGGFSALISDTVEHDKTAETVAQATSMTSELELPESDPFSAVFTAPIETENESSQLFSEKAEDENVEAAKLQSKLFAEVPNAPESDQTVDSSGNKKESSVNTFVEANVEPSEIVIPKISSEPLVSRAPTEDLRARKEPEFVSTTDQKVRISTDFNSNLDSIPGGTSLDQESVEAARETLIFQPLSEARSLQQSPDSDESQTVRDAYAESDDRKNHIQPFGASAMPMPPKFDPLITQPSDEQEEPAELPETEKNWHTAEDSLLDHNPFSPPAAEIKAAPVEIKVEPRPSAINMSGVDEYIVDRPNPLAGFFWFLVSAAFVVLLGLQVKYFLVERFAQDEAYRPYLQLFCGVARCELPPRRDAYRFTITQTRVDLHPQEPGALRITVRLLNQAKFAQPYPELRLTLTDRVGRVVGRRKFHPDFYLAKGTATRLASGELGYVVFDLARPHEKAVGFVVDVVRRTS